MGDGGGTEVCLGRVEEEDKEKALITVFQCPNLEVIHLDRDQSQGVAVQAVPPVPPSTTITDINHQRRAADEKIKGEEVQNHHQSITELQAEI